MRFKEKDRLFFNVDVPYLIGDRKDNATPHADVMAEARADFYWEQMEP